jgi:hypothetical protein
MKPVKTAKIIIVSILILSITACSNNVIKTETLPTQTLTKTSGQVEIGTPTAVTQDDTPEATKGQPMIQEVEVVPLRLPERIQAASFEYSGMAWFGEYLVLLPQFPEGKDFSRDANLFAIAKEDLMQGIKNPGYELPVKDVPILNSDLRKVIKGFEGFEAIQFVDQKVYLTIESHGGDPMMGYLIQGEVEGELESISIDPESLVELVPLSSAQNATFEAITIWNGKIYVIYEHNSKQGDAQPIAYQYNLDFEFEGNIAFPAIDYRVTDATISDPSGKFWVMNYFFPGDTHLAVDQDALVLEYGEGKTHTENDPVERLVQLQIGDNQISRIDQPPIYLQLLENNIARNWEGVVLLDDLGFLIITDSFPGSLLGFCPIFR